MSAGTVIPWVIGGTAVAAGVLATISLINLNKKKNVTTCPVQNEVTLNIVLIVLSALILILAIALILYTTGFIRSIRARLAGAGHVLPIDGVTTAYPVAGGVAGVYPVAGGVGVAGGPCVPATVERTVTSTTTDTATRR